MEMVVNVAGHVALGGVPACQTEIPATASTRAIERLYRISEVATILRVSRPHVYNILRGESVVDLSRPGRRGIKLVPESTLRRVLERHKRQFR
jgi:hypothetical protein